MNRNFRPNSQESGQAPQSAVDYIISREHEQDGKVMRLAIVVALLVHGALSVMYWPSFADASTARDKPKDKYFPVKVIKFTPPEPPKVQQIRPPSRTVIIPDATPDDPEPIREDSIDIPENDYDDDMVFVLPGPPPREEPSGPVRFHVGGKITEPEKISGPLPLYTEAARRTRTEGTVVLECIIDRSGVVSNITTLRRLPLGLTESAVSAVQQWHFKPSTLNGNPVDVIYVLTVTFKLN